MGLNNLCSLICVTRLDSTKKTLDGLKPHTAPNWNAGWWGIPVTLVHRPNEYSLQVSRNTHL